MSLFTQRPYAQTGNMLSALVAQWAQRSMVKTIQNVNVTCLDNATSGTAAIASVVTNLTLLRLRGLESSIATGWGALTPANVMQRLALTNSTTLTLSKAGTTGAGAASITWRVDVVEFRPGAFKYIERGTIAMAAGATSNTATLAQAVTTSKCELMLLGIESTDGASALNLQFVESSLTLTNGTTITASRNAQDGQVSQVIGYQLAEYW